MQTTKNKNRKIPLNAGKLLFCLLSSLLLANLLPSAMSSQISHRIGSTGSITYNGSNATLILTDSTLEGPVPYEVDGNLGYQTGSTYSISAGVHTIELPSPYTSPISDITYYFSYWQDGSTDNPRTITLEPDVAAELHGIYSTSSEPPSPPPPPEPDITMPSDYLYYSGLNSRPPPWEDGPCDTCRWVGEYGGNTAYVSSTRSWDVDVNGEPTGSSLYVSNPRTSDYGRFGVSGPSFNSGFWHREYYRSEWIYFDEVYNERGWWEWAECREFDAQFGKWGLTGSSLNIMIYGYAPNYYWRFAKDHIIGQTPKRRSYDIYVRPTSYTWSTYPTDEGVNPGWTPENGNLIVNPHRVPWQSWFRLEFYFRRGSYNDGIFTVWITDPFHPDSSKRSTRILFHIQNVDTSDCIDRAYTSSSMTGLFKQYGWMGVAYYDEVYVYNYNIRD